MAYALVSDDTEMAKRGDTTPEWVQEAAARALVGMFKGRQYRSYEERKRY